MIESNIQQKYGNEIEGDLTCEKVLVIDVIGSRNIQSVTKKFCVTSVQRCRKRI